MDYTLKTTEKINHQKVSHFHNILDRILTEESLLLEDFTASLLEKVAGLVKQVMNEGILYYEIYLEGKPFTKTNMHIYIY